MAQKNILTVGDVIMSPMFALGYYNNEDKKLINVDGKTKKYPVTSNVAEEERVAAAAKSGKVPPKTRTVELGAYDPSRADSKFVVEEARVEKGGTSNGDYYPDQWYVRARRLNEDGVYNPCGEVICFYTTRDSAHWCEQNDVRVVGKMQMLFV